MADPINTCNIGHGITCEADNQGGSASLSSIRRSSRATAAATTAGE